jgi:hypothetical protein
MTMLNNQRVSNIFILVKPLQFLSHSEVAPRDTEGGCIPQPMGKAGRPVR